MASAAGLLIEVDGGGGVGIELTCQVCGKVEQVDKWRPEYEEVQEGKEPPYICASCEAKIRAEIQHHPAEG